MEESRVPFSHGGMDGIEDVVSIADCWFMMRDGAG